MSTTIKLHIRHEEMTADMLKSRGHLDAGLKSLVEKATSKNESEREWDELIEEANQYEIGVKHGNECLEDEIVGYLKTLTVINDKLIDDIRWMVKDYDRDRDLIEWLNNNRGEEVFAIAW